MNNSRTLLLGHHFWCLHIQKGRWQWHSIWQCLWGGAGLNCLNHFWAQKLKLIWQLSWADEWAIAGSWKCRDRNKVGGDKPNIEYIKLLNLTNKQNEVLVVGRQNQEILFSSLEITKGRGQWNSTLLGQLWCTKIILSYLGKQRKNCQSFLAGYLDVFIKMKRNVEAKKL